MTKGIDEAIQIRMEALVAEGLSEEDALEEAVSDERVDFARAMRAVEGAEWCSMRFDGGRDYEEHGLDFDDIDGIIVRDYGVEVDSEMFTAEHVAALDKVLCDVISDFCGRYGYSRRAY